MKAIFIGGPLHGQFQEVGNLHNQVVYRPPNACVDEVSETCEIFRYSKFFGSENVSVFCLEGSNTKQQLLDVIQRGLGCPADPPLVETIKILFDLHAGHVFFEPAEDRRKNAEFLIDLVRNRWDREIKYRSRR